MTTEIALRNDEKPAASRWRRFSAVAGVAALACAGTVIAASPASASESCGSYHNWTECIRYSGGVLAVSAYNGYGSGYTENLWLNNYSFDGIYIPSGQWSAWYGYPVATGPVHACAGIDSVTIICTNL
jgi:hypothetical protein